MRKLLLLLLLTYSPSVWAQATCHEATRHAKTRMASAFLHDYLRGLSESSYNQLPAEQRQLIEAQMANEAVSSTTEAQWNAIASLSKQVLKERREKLPSNKLATHSKIETAVLAMLDAPIDANSCQKSLQRLLQQWSDSFLSRSFPGSALKGRKGPSVHQSLKKSVATWKIQSPPPSPVVQPNTAKAPSDAEPKAMPISFYWILLLAVLGLGGWVLVRRLAEKEEAKRPVGKRPLVKASAPEAKNIPEVKSDMPKAPPIKPEWPEAKAAAPQEAPKVEEKTPMQETPPAPQGVPATIVANDIQEDAPPVVSMEEEESDLPAVLYLAKPFDDKFLATDMPNDATRFSLDPHTGAFDLAHGPRCYEAIRRSFTDVLSDKVVMVTEGYGRINFHHIETIQEGELVFDGNYWAVSKKLILRIV